MPSSIALHEFDERKHCVIYVSPNIFLEQTSLKFHISKEFIASSTERTTHVDSVFEEDIKHQCMNDHSLLYLNLMYMSRVSVSLMQW